MSLILTIMIFHFFCFLFYFMYVHYLMQISDVLDILKLSNVLLIIACIYRAIFYSVAAVMKCISRLYQYLKTLFKNTFLKVISTPICLCIEIKRYNTNMAEHSCSGIDTLLSIKTTIFLYINIYVFDIIILFLTLFVWNT